MGTRADFYVEQTDGQLDWLGSIAWDGYPGGLPRGLLGARTESGFRHAVAAELASRNDATLPDKGWPWPWDDSHTSDYGYVFRKDCVMFEYEGHWFKVSDHDAAFADDADSARFRQGEAKFPDMSARKAVTLGRRSGLIIMGAQAPSPTPQGDK